MLYWFMPPLLSVDSANLVPSPFPEKEYLKVKALQPIFNTLVDNMARDRAFIDDVMKEYCY